MASTSVHVPFSFFSFFLRVGAAKKNGGAEGRTNHRPSLQVSNVNSHLGLKCGAWRVANVDMAIFRRYEDEIGCWVKRRDARIAKHRRAMSLLCKDTNTYAVPRCDGRNRDLRENGTEKRQEGQLEPSKASRLRCP
ncbi:hypothetical protein QBC32DRAFT_343762 [Pseudoneurospora amorphoporcata]|uniref:Secreted protein n=1 Tax=Pseudoneurospora amorphoporcata TaxID=241081 RepID=A0AAN6SFB0_9PEZI|nr:hypothetical protein QBC32DRAFT_343762 [Pseudoneurospora amorphoporcata]